MGFAPLSDPDTYVRGVPHDTLTWLRDNDPAHWMESHDTLLRTWVLGRHLDDALAAGRGSRRRWR